MDKKKTESTKDYRESFQKLLMSLGAPEQSAAYKKSRAKTIDMYVKYVI